MFNRGVVFTVFCFFSISLLGFGGNTDISLSTNNITGELIENCDSSISFILITRDSVATDTIRYLIQRSGSAQDSIDYLTNIPDTLLFTPGQQVVGFDIIALLDTLVELPETLRFDLYQIGTVDTLCDSLNIIIRDELDLKITTLAESSFCFPPDVKLIGTGAIDYLWSPGALFTDATNDTVSVRSEYTDPIILTGMGKGCTVHDTIELKFFNSNFTADLSPSDSICLGDEVQLIIHPLGTLDTIIVLPDSIFISSNDTIFTLQPVQTGQIFIETRSGTCVSMDSLSIWVDRINTPTLISDSTICLGDTLVLAAPFTNTLNSQFQWTPSEGLSADIISSPRAYPLVTTSYNLRTTGALGICQIDDVVNIEVIDNRFEYTLLGLDTFCLGGQVKAALNTFSDPMVSITPSPSASFSGDTITFFPSVSTTFDIKLDFGICEQNFQENITVINPQTDIEFLTPSTICIGDSIRVKLIFNDRPSSISWTPDDVIQRLSDSIYIFAPIESSSYDLSVDYEFCQYEETISLNVIDNLFEVDLPGDTVICQGQRIDGTLSFNREPTSITVVPETDAILFGTRIAFTPTQTTTYDIIADYGACVITKSIRIGVDSLPDLSLAAFPDLNTYCEDQTVELIPASFDPSLYPNLSFNWTPVDQNIVGPSNRAGLELIALTSQSYARASINGVCRSELNYELDVTPSAINIPYTDTSICIGNMVPFLIEDMDINDIVWSPPINISCEFCPDPSFAPTETTTYTVQYSRQNCTFSESVQVRVSALDTTYFEPIIDCRDSIIQINIDNSIFDNSVWDNDPDLSCLVCNDPTIRITQPKTFIIRDFDAMCEHVGILEVDVYPDISTSILVLNEDEDIFLGQVVNVEANIQADNNVSINWTVNGQLNSETSPNLSITAEEFRYTILLEIVDNETGCTAIDEVVITIKSIDEIRFPNVFSPNEDGRNDFFKPALADVLMINSMRIFNRWGQVVFQSNAADARWDGRMPDGQAAAPDTYVYIVELTRPNGIKEQHQGDINLLR